MRPRRQAQTVPPLAERQQPGLSETLTGAKDPARCQSCGGEHSKANPLTRWKEHDEYDRPPAMHGAIVVLCERCSKRLIEPHARLYSSLWPGEPWFGCMGICVGCAHRDGVSCRSPDKAVLTLRWDSEPIAAHLYYGGGRGEFRTLYHGPARACSGFLALYNDEDDEDEPAAARPHDLQYGATAALEDDPQRVD